MEEEESEEFDEGGLEDADDVGRTHEKEFMYRTSFKINRAT